MARHTYSDVIQIGGTAAGRFQNTFSERFADLGDPDVMQQAWE
jgi:hypothetical protein